MERSDLIKSPEYWTTKLQIDLYNCAETFMAENGKNRTQLAQHLGVTKGYVTQLLNGDYDHKISKFVALALAFGYIPVFDFVRIDEYLSSETRFETNTNWKEHEYISDEICKSNVMLSDTCYYPIFKPKNDAA